MKVGWKSIYNGVPQSSDRFAGPYMYMLLEPDSKRDTVGEEFQ